MPYIPKQEWDALKEKVRIAHDVALKARDSAKEIDRLRIDDYTRQGENLDQWAAEFRKGVKKAIEELSEHTYDELDRRFDDIRRSSVDRQVQVDAMELAMRHLKLSGEEVDVDSVRNLALIYADHIQTQAEPRELLLDPIESEEPVTKGVVDDYVTGIKNPDGFVNMAVPDDLPDTEPEHDSQREAIEMVIKMFREVESKGEQLYYAPLHRAIDHLAHVTGYDEEVSLSEGIGIASSDAWERIAGQEGASQ